MGNKKRQNDNVRERERKDTGRRKGFGALAQKSTFKYYDKYMIVQFTGPLHNFIILYQRLALCQSMATMA